MDAENDEKPSWYEKDVKSINPEAQELLEEYSGLRNEDVLSHVLAMRDEAFKVCPYPCIGRMRFLAIHIKRHPLYERILEHLRNDPEAGLLDAGCCVGQEIRYLAHQGIQSRQLFGLDVEKPFIDLGYDLFKDRDRLDATFALGNLTDDRDNEALVKSLGGKIDIVFASSLLHLWDYETQLKVATRLVRLLRDRPGVMVVGRQAGSLYAGEYPLAGFSDGMQYRHSAQSLKGMWHDIEEVTHTQWKVEASLTAEDVIQQDRDAPWRDASLRVIWWSATRVK